MLWGWGGVEEGSGGGVEWCEHGVTAMSPSCTRASNYCGRTPGSHAQYLCTSLLLPFLLPRRDRKTQLFPLEGSELIQMHVGQHRQLLLLLLLLFSFSFCNAKAAFSFSSSTFLSSTARRTRKARQEASTPSPRPHRTARASDGATSRPRLQRETRSRSAWCQSSGPLGRRSRWVQTNGAQLYPAPSRRSAARAATEHAAVAVAASTRLRERHQHGTPCQRKKSSTRKSTWSTSTPSHEERERNQCQLNVAAHQRAIPAGRTLR